MNAIQIVLHDQYAPPRRGVRFERYDSAAHVFIGLVKRAKSPVLGKSIVPRGVAPSLKVMSLDDSADERRGFDSIAKANYFTTFISCAVLTFPKRLRNGGP